MKQKPILILFTLLLFSGIVKAQMDPEDDIVPVPYRAAYVLALDGNYSNWDTASSSIYKFYPGGKHIKSANIYTYSNGNKTLSCIKQYYYNSQFDNLDSITHSVYNNNNNYYYDNFVNVSYSDINKLNNIYWYDNNTITQEIINILNNHFKYIIITLLISSKLINQLIEQYNGIIVFRFFGLQKNGRYKSLLNDRNILIYKENINNKIKFLFSYPEIYEFEKSFDNYFNDKNSYITRLGLSNNLINKIINTYTPINNTICFVHSKINYYPCCTQIYNEFVNNFKNYDYLLLGRNNFIEDKYKLDNNINSKNYPTF